MYELRNESHIFLVTLWSGMIVQ